MAGGDQPHFWADAQYVNLFRHLFVMEEGSTLLVTPALFHRWHQGNKPILVRRLPTHFGDVDLAIEPTPNGDELIYKLKLTPKGDQNKRELSKIVLYPRTANGRPLAKVTINGRPAASFMDTSVIISEPSRSRELEIRVQTRP
jgi:hypothetical protein